MAYLNPLICHPFHILLKTLFRGTRACRNWSFVEKVSQQLVCPVALRYAHILNKWQRHRVLSSWYGGYSSPTSYIEMSCSNSTKMHQSYLIADFPRYYIKPLGLILFGVSQKFDLVIISPIPTRTHGIGIDAVSSKSQLPIS